MSIFPPEIWHLICPYLALDDLCSLRLAGKITSEVAAEYLIPCLRIETSLESLEKLKNIAEHPALRKGVKRLTYEAGLLANVGCVHRYKAHYQTDNHDSLPAPVEPSGTNATPRARRLYEREEKKFDTAIQARFAKYRTQFKEQQDIKDGFQSVIKSSLAMFKLNHVMLKTGSVCAHVLSQQFKKRYCNDCAIPLSGDPDHSIWQFVSVLVPGLTKLAAQQLSLKIFGSESGQTKPWLMERFAGIQYLCIELKQGRQANGEPETFEIADSWLADALGAASGSLRSLLINFDLTRGELHAGKFEDLIPARMSDLRHLDINFLTTTEDSFITILKGMPKLDSLFIAFMELTRGLWLTTARRLRNELNLTDFMATGLLEDSVDTVATDHCDREMWCDGERFTITSALMLYVTDKEFSSPNHFGSEEDFEICCNPFSRLEDFEDEEDLIFELGPVDPSDLEEEIDADGDEDKSDDEMPDLAEDTSSSMDMEVD